MWTHPTLNVSFVLTVMRERLSLMIDMAWNSRLRVWPRNILLLRTNPEDGAARINQDFIKSLIISSLYCSPRCDAESPSEESVTRHLKARTYGDHFERGIGERSGWACNRCSTGQFDSRVRANSR